MLFQRISPVTAVVISSYYGVKIEGVCSTVKAELPLYKISVLTVLPLQSKTCPKEESGVNMNQFDLLKFSVMKTVFLRET